MARASDAERGAFNTDLRIEKKIIRTTAYIYVHVYRRNSSENVSLTLENASWVDIVRENYMMRFVSLLYQYKFIFDALERILNSILYSTFLHC